MKKNKSVKIVLSLLILVSIVAPGFAQRGRKPIIFAVLNEGKSLEPIAFIEKGKLTPPVGGDSDQNVIAAFNKTYYTPKAAYRLIFGGANAGTATVLSSDAKAECAKNTAQVSVSSTKTKLGGFVMALATDAAAKKAASGLRRKPAPAERAEIESLVRAEFANQKVAASAIKNLHYHNLTALDVDNDKKADFVGSFWVDSGKTERALLFFIAEKNAKGKYAFGYSEFRIIKQEDVMSNEIKSVDEGIYHELLLDVFDYDNDGVSEIFTYIPSFEGTGFNAYKRENGSWKRSFEGSNYHCGY
ncbi:MAG TPA: hypothetical protein VNB22_20530 [Pyrinomonadaceae bacterium]|jgi:hypothetical protein|nr:hypothetical protein [Pyrinomonadaceae bacterium]